MIRGMIGRKLGMMRLYDGGGEVRAVTVIELGPNRVTQLRTVERDGYEAVQVGYVGNRKRLTRPQRGHLGRAGLGNETLSRLQEFPADNPSAHETGEVLTCEQFEPGQYVDVSGVSKGRGFAGGVKRWGFHGGPKTHGQSDRHRAPGSIGAGTTPGKVWKGQKMAGHMGARNTSVLNLLVVQSDTARNLIFVEGSVPGPPKGLVTVTPGRKPPRSDFEPPELPAPPVMEVDEPEPDEPEEIVAAGDADEPTDATETEAADATETEAADATETEAAEATETEAADATETEAAEATDAAEAADADAGEEERD